MVNVRIPWPEILVTANMYSCTTTQNKSKHINFISRKQPIFGLKISPKLGKVSLAREFPNTEHILIIYRLRLLIPNKFRHPPSFDYREKMTRKSSKDILARKFPKNRNIKIISSYSWFESDILYVLQTIEIMEK